ncbi:DUF4091 domain-containing protein [Chitinophaga sp. 212800010-3]|uniref:DUF4091 domain-containing protein n=1 Tax=unclassified Chitinophaga TaxID=2619133 RepID=UPI002DECCE40|nr:DUF4091 domain-containing protein [Chitinophaga sp. 212800010-3]
MLKHIIIGSFVCLLTLVSGKQANGMAADTTFSCWLETSLHRVFPQSPPGKPALALLAARNSRISFQACFRNNTTRPSQLSCRLEGAEQLQPRIRYAGLVPMHHFTPNTARQELDGTDYLPGLVPDPLWPLSTVEANPFASRSFWITLQIPADISPGKHLYKVYLTYGQEKKEVILPLEITVSKLVVKPRRDFPVTHWWRGEATWDYYKTGMFDERWWSLTKAQLEDMLDHGSDVVYVPVFFDRRETFKRPCQLLTVDEISPGTYRFDWAMVKRFVDMCKAIGFKKFEWSHLWIYWGVKNPMRIYTKKDDHYDMLWPPDISATSPVYIHFLQQFLPEFHHFLEQEKILTDSYFHLSDEPGSAEHVENYRRARQILRDLAPWMKVMDALSDIAYGRQGLTDIPVPLIDAAQAYINEKIPHWVYFCCGPQGPWLNRFFDTPLPKVRMSGWLFYKLQAKGFLHWGFNYWHKIEKEETLDPFTDGSAAAYPGIPYGDPFEIYPGPDGPIDSIRWEVFAESLQDYAILQTAGIDPDDKLLTDIHSYADFPKSEEWLNAALLKVLSRK